MHNKKELESESDENLLFLFTNSKNREALDALLERHMASAYHIAYQYMHNQADAEDVVQKAFINVMRFAESQKQPGMVKAWIMKTVINTSKNEIKHLIRQRKLLQNKSLLPSSENKSQNEENEELRKILISAIEQLPDHFRLPIWLTHYENMTVKEVSHTLGKSENTIRTQLSRGLEKLENSLKGYGSKVCGLSAIALIAECKKTAEVPPTLHAKVKSISAFKESARMVAHVSSQNLNLSWLIPSAMVVVTGCLCFFWWQNKTEKPNKIVEASLQKTVQKEVEITKNNQTNHQFNLFWNFDSNKLPEWFSVKEGNYSLVSDLSKKTNSLKVLDKEDFLMDIAIPNTQNSFKVTYDAKIVPIANETFHIFSLTNLTKKKGVTFLFNNKIDRDKWIRVEIYVQKNLEAIYYDNTLMMVVVYPLSNENEYSLHFKGAVAFIDNLEVKSLEEKHYKDVSNCLELGNEFLSKDGFHSIMIPSPIPKANPNKINVYWGGENLPENQK